LVLPAAWVTTEYLLHLILPLGTFFSVAYTQSMNLPLLQVMSITGLWGVTFLVAWLAGVINYAWEGDSMSKPPALPGRHEKFDSSRNMVAI
jgi:apolipoprotein N-acyltransferase